MRAAINLIERIDTNQFYTVAEETIRACMVANRGEDYGELKRAMRSALSGMVRRFEDPAHPLSIMVDFLGAAADAGTAASFTVWEEKGTIILELWKLVPDAWETDPAAVDLDRLSARIARILAHEFAHYQQNLPAWGLLPRDGVTAPARDVPSAVRRAGSGNPYLSRSNEIGAHAIDAARELEAAFGSPQEAVQALRRPGGINAAILHSPALRRFWSLRGTAAGDATFRAFLRRMIGQLFGHPAAIG